MSRAALTSLIKFLAAFMIMEAMFLLVMLVAPPKHADTAQTLKVRDISLMTEEQKREARSTGVACYDVNGVHYVDHSLHPNYYRKVQPEYRRKDMDDIKLKDGEEVTEETFEELNNGKGDDDEQ